MARLFFLSVCCKYSTRLDGVRAKPWIIEQGGPGWENHEGSFPSARFDFGARGLASQPPLTEAALNSPSSGAGLSHQSPKRQIRENWESRRHLKMRARSSEQAKPPPPDRGSLGPSASENRRFGGHSD